MIYGAVKPEFDPIADRGAVITAPRARFTILTSRLIRMEYSPEETFEDRPSQAIWNRRLPVPHFSAESGPEGVTVETEHLLLRYRATKRGFSASNLTVTVKATGATWHYGDTYRRSGNLGGTYRTLDETAGQIRLEPGLMARSGWALVDDSAALVFNEDAWLAQRQQPENLDLYFFGYGWDYTACLQDFARLAGKVPIIPRWALGNWWSRYWRYTADELLGVVDEFRAHNVPLSVCIVDMDWHLTTTGSPATGWTGYTWNRELFPDPEGFLRALHTRGLKTALNLHPAEGVWPHEAQFPAFADFMEIDPQDPDAIPFDAADRRFMQAYFRLLHHPFEDQGVDFWWMDWQQGTRTHLDGLDPLWWLNHLHFYDLARDGRKRPFIFSRWGGLGNHRYPIGFSGDTEVNWDVLEFQPYFTATAANVNYGWWSHDIGGHMLGIEDDELFVRWVQYGVFSPIFRLHSTHNAYHERRPWGRGLEAGILASRAMRLRHALIPYLYSMAWRNHTASLPPALPMYYTHPQAEEAYRCPGQYWFGDQMIAAPYTRPAGEDTRLTRQTVWLPAGEWYDFWSGERFGAGWHTLYGGLDEIPVFARAGAIVPLDGRYLEDTGTGKSVRSQADTWRNPETLEVLVFPGADGQFELFEDDGETTGYLNGEYALTRFSLRWRQQWMLFTIHAAAGSPGALPAKRSYRVRARGVERPHRVSARLDGEEWDVPFEYDLENAELVIGPFSLRPSQELAIDVATAGEGLAARRDRSLTTLRKYLTAFRLLTRVKADIDHKWPELAAGRMDLRSFAALTGEQANALRSILERD